MLALTMAATDIIRESWATRMGFILAAVGSAVGLGNIWRFPFVVGENGGAAFLLIYLILIVLIGFAAMLVEFSVGRRTERNPVGALREMGGEAWKYVGGLFILIGFVILSYYSVVAGWALRYTVGSLTQGYMEDPGAYFGLISAGWEAIAFHALFMLLVIGIVAFGIRQGIELAVKVMVPAIIVLIVGLAIYAATLPNVGEAYSYYLSPDFGVIADNWQSILPAAAGQAFFTLSLGMGVMITYASYLGEDRNLGEDGAIILGLDTGVAFITGLVAFPILFAAAVDPADPGPAVIFISLAEAFGDITAGWIIGFLFFATLSIAALSSAISLMEVVVSYAIDERGMDRRTATFGIGGLIFLLGIPTALDTTILGLYDALAAEILLITGGILLAILVGWIVHEEAREELSKGIGDLGWYGDAWIWLVRVPVLLVLIVSLVLAILGFVEFVEATFLEAE